MSSTIQYHGQESEEAARKAALRSDLRSNIVHRAQPLTGFSEAAMDFCLNDAMLSQPQQRQSQYTSIAQDRKQVEDLLQIAGAVSPPGSARSSVQALVDDVTDTSVDWVRPRPSVLPDNAADRCLKRAFDIAVSTLALVLLTPLLCLIGLALRLEGGSALYYQSRVGRSRKRFTCIKFRTMRPDAEDRLNLLLACNDAAREEWRLHQKLQNDPRVTPLGRLLRESSMDELPQLINVLRGEMSLVGPRPIVAPEIDGYDADRAYFESAAFEEYAASLPGITGLWQVSGRHRTVYLDRVRLDRQYVRTWSFWLDLTIIWKTIGVVLRRSGR